MKAFENAKLGGIALKNRLAMAPMTTYSANEDLTPSQEELDYLERRSLDVGMVISPAISVNEYAQAFHRQITLKDDTFVEPMSELVRTIQNGGAKAIAQLHHGGRMNDPSLYEDKSAIVSASAVKAPRKGAVTPRAMDVSDIEATIEDFKVAALRALRAGFDGVELHGANTYLLQQFFSPHSNIRTDAYGGTLEKRLRFIGAIVDGVKEVIENYSERPFILGYRFSPEELEEDGITMEHTKELLKFLKQTPVDYVHVSLQRYNQSSIRDEQNQTPLVVEFRNVLDGKKPLMASGNIRTREDLRHAESLGYDFFAAGVSLLADPRWGKKVYEGETPKTTFDRETLPKPLYNRMKKNRKRFEEKGYSF